MDTENLKETLLNTPMHKFNLGLWFTKYFFDMSETTYYVGNTFRRMKSSDVVTLEEFFEMNNNSYLTEFVITRKDDFNPKKNCLHRETTNFLRLLKFLREAGFTKEDWVFLKIKSTRSEKKKLTAKKEDVLEMPVVYALGMYQNCQPLKILSGFLQKPVRDVLVKHVMTIDDDQALEILPAAITLQKMQRRLRRLGFTDADGTFMQASLDF